MKRIIISLIIFIHTNASIAFARDGCLRQLALDERGIDACVRILVDGTGSEEEYAAAVSRLRSRPDKGFVSNALREAAQEAICTRISSVWDKFGLFVQQESPEFIERYRERTRHLYTGRLTANYLMSLNRDIKLRCLGAGAIKRKLVDMLAAAAPSEISRGSWAILTDKIAALGTANPHNYTSSLITGRGISNQARQDEAYRQLGAYILRNDPGLLTKMEEKLNDHLAGYVMESVFVFLNEPGRGLGRREISETKRYIRGLIDQLVDLSEREPRNRFRLPHAQINRRILLCRLDSPQQPLAAALKSCPGVTYSENLLTMMGRDLSGAHKYLIETEPQLEVASRIMRAEPDREEDGRDEYCEFMIHQSVFSKGPVTIGHRRYYLDKLRGVRNKIVSTNGMAQVRGNGASRPAPRLVREGNIRSVVDACAASMDKGAVLPSLDGIARIAKRTREMILNNMSDIALALRRERRIPAVLRSWDDMRAGIRDIGLEDLREIDDMGLMADYIVTRGRKAISINGVQIDVAGYVASVEKSLGEKVLMICLSHDGGNQGISMSAVLKTGGVITQRSLDKKIRTDKKGRIVGARRGQSVKMESLFLRQSGSRPIRVGPRTGNFYLRCTAYRGLRQMCQAISANTPVDVAAVQVSLEGRRTKNPFIEIRIPGQQPEVIPLNTAFLPLCKGVKKGRHMYSLPGLLNEQTKLAAAGDKRFRPSPFVLAHPLFFSPVTGGINDGVRKLKYRDPDSVARELCRRAGLEYREGNRKLLERAIAHPDNKPSVLNLEDQQLIHYGRDVYEIIPRRRVIYSSVSGQWAALFKNAGMPYEPTKIYAPAEFERVLTSPNNSEARLRRKQPGLMRVIKKLGMIKLRAGPAGTAKDDLIAFVESLPEALTEHQARELWEKMMSGTEAEQQRAQVQLGDRLTALIPVAVNEFSKRGELIPGAYSSHLVDAANMALAEMLATGDMAWWNPGSGIGLLEYVKEGIKRGLEKGETEYRRGKGLFEGGHRRYSLDMSSEEDEDEAPWSANMDNEVAGRLTGEMDYAAVEEPDEEAGIELFSPGEKEAVARELAQFFKSADIENILKELGIRHCAIYIHGSMSYGGKGRKDSSNLNILFVTDGSADQNRDLLFSLRRKVIKAGEFRRNTRDIYEELPILWVGRDDTFEQVL